VPDMPKIHIPTFVCVLLVVVVLFGIYHVAHKH
jgi:Na+/glutamate symporter